MTDLMTRPAPSTARARSSLASRAVPALALLAIDGLGRMLPGADPLGQGPAGDPPGCARGREGGAGGGEFNKLFPKPEGDFDVVYTQEKPGFAQAKLVKKGQDVATLSIFDTTSNPEAAAKYKDIQETFEGSPIIEIGNNGTGLLVGNRYQVQIRSKDANFTKFDREDWLKKFDLANLAKLQ